MGKKIISLFILIFIISICLLIYRKEVINWFGSLPNSQKIEKDSTNPITINTNPTELGVVVGFKIDLKFVSNHKTDLYFQSDFLNVNKSKYCTKITANETKLVNDYNQFKITRHNARPLRPDNIVKYNNYFLFHKTIHVKNIICDKKITIGDNIYFYIVFEPLDIKIVITYVEEKDEDEIKKNLKNTIYILQKDLSAKFHANIRYTNKIIKTDDIKDKIKYMLLDLK